MPHSQYVMEIRARSEVFEFMDDICNVGWHMEGERSMRLMGGKLAHECGYAELFTFPKHATHFHGRGNHTESASSKSS